MYAVILSASLTLAAALGSPVIWTFDPPEPGLDEVGGWYHSLVNSEVYIDGALGSVSAPNALRLVPDYRAFHFGAAGAAVAMASTPGMEYAISGQVKADASNSSTHLLARAYEEAPGGGPGAMLVEFQITKANAGSGWFAWAPGSFTATTSGTIIEFVATDPLRKANGGAWLVDDVGVISDEEDAMTKRREIREALVATIETVTTGNGYTMSVGSVVTGPVRVDAGDAYPLVSVRHGEEVKTIHTLQRKSSVITFYIGVACRRTETDDPDDQADDLCGEIEKAIELFSGGQWLGLGYVENVFVSGVDTDELAPEVARDMAAWMLTVDVTYTHDRRQP